LVNERYDTNVAAESFTYIVESLRLVTIKTLDICKQRLQWHSTWSV